MKTFNSLTLNRGTTIIISTVAEACELGQAYVDGAVKKWESVPASNKIQIQHMNRDKGKVKMVTRTAGHYLKRCLNHKMRFANCVQAITHGDQAMADEIKEKTDSLEELAVNIAPMLQAGFRGYTRADEGVAVSTELLLSGDPLPFFKRKQQAELPRDGVGDGAFRVLINTDVSWWGNPSDNSALIGALVLVLQRFKPVEVWIQQGWLGPAGGDGVTLFKLDFSTSFDATALTFWVGYHDRDFPFSMAINQQLGREGTDTSKFAEIESDLYLRGDWMKQFGIDQATFEHMLFTDKLDIFAKWISDTAMKIVFDESGESN